jgi:hypothetical protein
MSELTEENLEALVAPEDIERTLKKIRVDRSGGSLTAKPNIILSNFVITVPLALKRVRKQLEEMLEELALLVPSRFFIVSLGDSGTAKLATAVRLTEVKSSSGQHFFSEEVFVEAGTQSLSLVSSLLRSLCVSDAPIISYVMGEPIGGADSDVESLLNQLREMCDLILYDSKEFNNYSSSVNSLFSLRRIVRPANEEASRKLAPSSVRIRDLNWYRLEKLRSLLAGLYDAGGFSSSAIKSVELIIAQPKPTPTSLILSGWLNEIFNKAGLVKIVSDQKVSGASSSYIKVLVKGENFDISVSQDGDSFEVTTGESTRKLNSKSPSTSQLISLPVQASGLDDYFTKSLERSLAVTQS